MTVLSSETLHASCVAIGGRAVLIAGSSGTGKSDLSLRLIDRGAALVSDDYTLLRRSGTALLAAPPTTIAGRIEVRGIGIVEMAHVADIPVALIVAIAERPERMPLESRTRHIAGIEVPCITLPALEPSAPIKVEMALARTPAR